MELKKASAINWYDMRKIESPYYATRKVLKSYDSAFRMQGLDSWKRDRSHIPSSRRRQALKDDIESGNYYLVTDSPSAPLFYWAPDTEKEDEGSWRVSNSGGYQVSASAGQVASSVKKPASSSGYGGGYFASAQSETPDWVKASEGANWVEHVPPERAQLKEQRTQSALPKEDCCKKRVPDIAPTPNSADYYQRRHDDFVSRYHDGCEEQSPPSYYLEYGFKYCDKFLKETRDDLSPEGKKWLDATLINLQKFMEEGVVQRNFVSKYNMEYNAKYGLTKDDTSEAIAIKIKHYTGIECNDWEHRYFAFATHTDAYNPEWMQYLPCSDLLKIVATPDILEWRKGETWEQAFIMMDEMGGLRESIERCLEYEAGYRKQLNEGKTASLADIHGVFE